MQEGLNPLPCPFCGDDEPDIFQAGPNLIWYITCANTDCQCSFNAIRRENIIAAWNTRPADSPKAAKVEDVETGEAVYSYQLERWLCPITVQEFPGKTFCFGVGFGRGEGGQTEAIARAALIKHAMEFTAKAALQPKPEAKEGRYVGVDLARKDGEYSARTYAHKEGDAIVVDKVVTWKHGEPDPEAKDWLTRERVLELHHAMRAGRLLDNLPSITELTKLIDMALAALTPSPKEEGTLLGFTSSIMREQTQRLHRLDEQLYPLREVQRIADLVWRDAERVEEGEETYFAVSPRFMELLSDALATYDKKVKALAPQAEPIGEREGG